MGFMMMLVTGVLLCSLLCVVAALHSQGEVLQRPAVMLLCQVYLVLAALIQVAGAEMAVVSQVAGFLVLALGVAPSFFRKHNFDAARYCIALGGALAACALFLL